MTTEEIKELLNDTITHLEYCGYGDNWERQHAEKLMKRVDDYIEYCKEEKE